MIRLLCPDPESFSPEGLIYAKQYSNLTAVKLTQREFDDAAHRFDAVLVRFNTRVGENILRGRCIKAVLSPTTGLDHIDIEAAKNNNVKIYHLKNQKQFLRKITATAELTIGLMIAASRKISPAFQSVKNGNWRCDLFRGVELSGKTVGVVGCGRLGEKVAKICLALEMNVIVFDPYVKILPAGVTRITKLHKLIQNSDVITFHVPLTPETTHMIGARELNMARCGAILINTSRGAVLNQDALLAALVSKKIGAVGLDVIENEHLFERDKVNKLIEYSLVHDNIIITPHIGGATFDSVKKTDMFVLQQFFKDTGLVV
jgi:D-3-phosphoglycerate dehydrogenase